MNLQIGLGWKSYSLHITNKSSRHFLLKMSKKNFLYADRVLQIQAETMIQLINEINISLDYILASSKRICVRSLFRVSRPVRNPASGPTWPLLREHVVCAKSIMRRSTTGSWLDTVPLLTRFTSAGGADVSRSNVDSDEEEASSEPDEHSDTGDSHSWGSGLHLFGDLRNNIYRVIQYKEHRKL